MARFKKIKWNREIYSWFSYLSSDYLKYKHKLTQDAFKKSNEFRSLLKDKIENFNYYKNNWKLRKHSILYILLCILPFFFCFLFIIIFLSFCDFFTLNNWLVWIIFVFLVLLCSFCSVKIEEYKSKNLYKKKES